jgi:hypothetical protein
LKLSEANFRLHEAADLFRSPQQRRFAEAVQRLTFRRRVLPELDAATVPV